MLPSPPPLFHPNAILQLREKQLAEATKPFRARGSKVLRCNHCLLPKRDCICSARPQVACASAFCFIMYRGESRKPSNTGRLIADVVADHHAFLWHRTEHDSALLSLLQNPCYAPILVFPQEYAEPARCIRSPQELPSVSAGRTPLFILLDGTWREAKKIFKSPYLATLPVLGIQPERASTYLMRDAAHSHQLCTAEVAIEALRLAQENTAADALADYFRLFCHNYARVRPQLHEKPRAQQTES